jgi:phage antirepressor YoqD-like protein
MTVLKYSVKDLAKELQVPERKVRKILRDSKVSKDKYYWEFTDIEIERIKNTIKRGMA